MHEPTIRLPPHGPADTDQTVLFLVDQQIACHPVFLSFVPTRPAPLPRPSHPVFALCGIFLDPDDLLAPPETPLQQGLPPLFQPVRIALSYPQEHEPRVATDQPHGDRLNFWPRIVGRRTEEDDIEYVWSEEGS